MPQTVSLDVDPTGYTETSEVCRSIVNNCNPQEVDLLLKIVTERIPVVPGENAFTEKQIIRTSRWECPCCYTTLTALVQVSCTGLCRGEKVSGLYKVHVGPDYQGEADCKIKVIKLHVTEEMIFQEKTEHLPRLRRPQSSV